MNILYCGDRKMETGMQLSALSLLQHTDEPLCIYVLTMSYEDDQTKMEPLRGQVCLELQEFLQQRHPMSRVERYDCSSLFERHLPLANMTTRFTPACMLRLYADLLPDIPHRILYLDTDVLALRDFTDFYHQPMNEIEFAGVRDYYGQWFYSHPFKRDYLNSGVLLMNMEAMRDTNLLARCRDLCAQRRMFLPDQHALNALVQRKRICERRYNDQRSTHEDTVFRHYTTTFRIFPPRSVTVKPWQPTAVKEVLREQIDDKLLRLYEDLTHSKLK
ncbi:MAG: glycosyltransferase [Candidatus Limimorpha sp.]